MNNLTKKPTAQDVFESIFCDYQYPSINTSGNINWILSQDIGNSEYLSCMELEELFVDRVAKSTDLPFVFDKTLDGTVLKKVNPLGSLFYDLLRRYNGIAVNPDKTNPCLIFPVPAKFITFNFYKHCKYEVSENLKILRAIATDLLNIVNFTGNPMQNLTPDYRLLEGELINSFVIRLRDAAKQKSFKKKLAERKKESTQNVTKTKRYIARLHENSLGLYGVPMVICYESQYANSITIKESDAHLMKFLESFETYSGNDSPVGWWWKREYIKELGYRYYLILFFDGQKTPNNPTEIQSFFGEHWRSVTGNRGAYFIPPVGSEQTLFMPGNSLGSLLLNIQSRLMRDIFLRLKLDLQFAHFGMGKLPKSVNSTTQGFGLKSPFLRYPVEAFIQTGVSELNQSALNVPVNINLTTGNHKGYGLSAG